MDDPLVNLMSKHQDVQPQVKWYTIILIGFILFFQSFTSLWSSARSLVRPSAWQRDLPTSFSLANRSRTPGNSDNNRTPTDRSNDRRRGRLHSDTGLTKSYHRRPQRHVWCCLLICRTYGKDSCCMVTTNHSRRPIETRDTRDTDGLCQVDRWC